MSELLEKILQIFQHIRDLIILLISIAFAYIRAVYKYFVPPQLDSLDGKVILITGSAGGIGRQICNQLATTTTNGILLCWDIDKQSNDAFVSDLMEQTGVKAFSYKVDVSDRSDVKTAIEKAYNEIGDIHVVINNAGIMSCKPFLQQSPEELEKPFDINVLAHFWILREILPRMIERNDGHIVTVCSAAGLIPTRNLAAYSGTKHAVHGFIESLKEEIRHDPRKPNIRFTTVYPYACNTALMSGVKIYSRFQFLVKALLQPKEVAERLVLGLRGNVEYVYIPDFISFAGTTAKCLPAEVQKLAVDFLNCYVGPEKKFTDKQGG